MSAEPSDSPMGQAWIDRKIAFVEACSLATWFGEYGEDDAIYHELLQRLTQSNDPELVSAASVDRSELSTLVQDICRRRGVGGGVALYDPNVDEA